MDGDATTIDSEIAGRAAHSSDADSQVETEPQTRQCCPKNR
jgi:hypothetical protein